MGKHHPRFIHTLTLSEIERILRTAGQRTKWAAEHHYSQRTSNGFTDEQAPEAHICGCAGELAVSLWTGLPWRDEFFDKIGPRPIDLGLDIEIKTSPKFMDLIVRTTDPVKGRYVRCTLGKHWSISIDGWMFGEEVRRDCYWRKGDPKRDESWYVPIAHLRPMTTFRKEASDDIGNFIPRRGNGRADSRGLGAGGLAAHARAV